MTEKPMLSPEMSPGNSSERPPAPTPPMDASESTANTGSVPLKAKRAGKLSALWVWLGILVLLLMGMGGAGYWGYVKWQQQHQALVALQDKVVALDQNISAQLKQRASNSELSRLAEDSQSEQRALHAAIESLQSALHEQKQLVDGMRQVIGQDENLWRLSEMERLLTAAQLRLGALDDPVGARQLLGEIERLSNPLGGEALPLRNAVQQLASPLDVSAPLDREGLALKMFNLAQMLPYLPQKSPQSATQAVAGEGLKGGAADWWTQTRAWFDSWWQIKNTTQESHPAPPVNASKMTEAVSHSAQAAAAQTLLDARHALLTRHVAQAYSLSVQAAQQARDALDPNAPQVQQALASLREVSAALEHGDTARTPDFAPAFAALRALRLALSPTPASTPGMSSSPAPASQPADASTSTPITKEP